MPCDPGQLDFGCGCGEGPPPCSQPTCPCTSGGSSYSDWIRTDDHSYNTNNWLNFGDFECGQEIPDTYNNAQNGLGNSVIGNCGPCRKTEIQFRRAIRVCQQGACDCPPSCPDNYYIHGWRCSDPLPECQGSNPPMSDSFGEFNPSEYTYFPPIPGLASPVLGFVKE